MEELERLETEYIAKERKVVDEQIHQEEDARIARLLVRTRETMGMFLKRATERKIDRLSRLITESFRFLLRKGTLVQRVLIDPATFAITLLDDSGRPMSAREIYEEIESRKLYQFKAKDPASIVRGQLWRHSEGVKGAASGKYFRTMGDGRFALIDR